MLLAKGSWPRTTAHQEILITLEFSQDRCASIMCSRVLTCSQQDHGKHNSCPCATRGNTVQGITTLSAEQPLQQCYDNNEACMVDSAIACKPTGQGQGLW